MKYILAYLFMINIVSLTVYGSDKHRAVKDKWRVPEQVLIMLAVLGGSIGALAAMLFFHHKTKKPLFVIGVPLILLAEAIAVMLFLMKYAQV